MDYVPNLEKIEFRDVVFRAQQKILDILSRELRLMKKIIPMGENRSEIILEEEDTRESFVQAVQGLGLILKPYFDEKMEKAYADFDTLVDMYYFEFYNEYKDYVKEIINMRKNLFRYNGEKNSDVCDNRAVENVHQREKVKRAKQIFKELNLLLKRQDYLKSAIYGDTESDDIVEEYSEEDSK
jgi:hypothetical protein